MMGETKSSRYSQPLHPPPPPSPPTLLLLKSTPKQSCVYFVDAVQNEGKIAGAAWSMFSSGTGSGKSVLQAAVNPALEAIDSYEGASLAHSDAERFLNKPMDDQIQCLNDWAGEADYDRFVYYLAVFARDRGSPHTDFPLNPAIQSDTLLTHIFDLHKKNIVVDGLFIAAASALAQHPQNARYLLNESAISQIVAGLKKGVDSETDTAYGLKTLALVAMHQEKSGDFESIIMKSEEKNKLVPFLLTLLKDNSEAHRNVFEPRYITQILSCLIRTHPSLLRSPELNGKYKDSEGNPITLFSSVREGVRYKTSFAVPYYLRLLRDCLQCDEHFCVGKMNEADIISVLVGLLQNNYNYTEVVPTIVKCLLMLNRKQESPGDILSYKDFLVICAVTIEKTGPFAHDVVLDIQELVDEAMADVSLPVSFIKDRKAFVHRYRTALENTLSRPERSHISAKWIQTDRERLKAATVVA